VSALLALWREAWPALLDGLGVGLAVTGLSLLLGLPLALGLALGARARPPWLRLLCRALAVLGRGTPVLILLQGLGSGLPGPAPAPFAAAVLALTGWTAAQGGAILTAALAAVPRGQWEAAGAIGLGRGDTLRFVLLPQGLRLAAPALLGLAVLLLQASALGVAVGLPDLVARALGLGGALSRVVPLLVLAALLYAAASLPVWLLAAALDRRRSR
jgi:polar amino acid transport system permease protein